MIKTMKIELELTRMEASRLQGICRQIGNTYKHFRNSPEGRSTLYGLSETDIWLIGKLSHALSDIFVDDAVLTSLKKDSFKFNNPTL